MTSRAASGETALVFNAGSVTVKVAGIVREPSSHLTRAAELVLDGHETPDGLLDRVIRGSGFADTLPPAVIGHRVVHGGPLRDAVLVDDSVERTIEQYDALAPLHNAASLAMIRAAADALPGVPQVAVFDTAFHANMPPEASQYALPADLAERFSLRRFGFHGISCSSATRAAAAHLGKDAGDLSLVICHLGGGASVTAVRHGSSVDTSMGLTPLGGLVMATRSGDVDPAVIPYLMRSAGLSAEAVLNMLMHRSGLLGLCGESDLRVVRRRADHGEESARMALAVYTHRIRHYVSAYLGLLPDLDALVFTGGIGEHDAQTRLDVVEPLRHLGLHMDIRANASSVEGAVTRIDTGTGPTAVLVVRADEETAIAREAFAVLDGRLSRG